MKDLSVPRAPTICRMASAELGNYLIQVKVLKYVCENVRVNDSNWCREQFRYVLIGTNQTGIGGECQFGGECRGTVRAKTSTSSTSTSSSSSPSHECQKGP